MHSLWLLVVSVVIDVEIIDLEDQHSTFSYQFHSTTHFGTFVNANVLYKPRRPLWAYLANFSTSISSSCLVIRYFNVVMGSLPSCWDSI